MNWRKGPALGEDTLTCTDGDELLIAIWDEDHWQYDVAMIHADCAGMDEEYAYILGRLRRSLGGFHSRSSINT